MPLNLKLSVLPVKSKWPLIIICKVMNNFCAYSCLLWDIGILCFFSIDLNTQFASVGITYNGWRWAIAFGHIWKFLFKSADSQQRIILISKQLLIH